MPRHVRVIMIASYSGQCDGQSLMYMVALGPDGDEGSPAIVTLTEHNVRAVIIKKSGYNSHVVEQGSWQFLFHTAVMYERQ